VFASTTAANFGQLSIPLQLWDDDQFVDDLLSGWSHLLILPPGTTGGGYYSFTATTLLWNQSTASTNGNASRLEGNAGAEMNDEAEAEVFAIIVGPTSFESNRTSVEIVTYPVWPN
jgi:hypothetical protein